MSDELWTRALDRMMVRVDDTAAQVKKGFPDHADPQTGRWTPSPDGSWTGGFWNGMLWLALATTKDRKYLDWAERWTELLRPRVQSENIFRSFLFYYGAALGDILVGNSPAREVGVLGARGLATLYNPDARAIPLGREAEGVSDVEVGPGDANVDGVQAAALLIWAARESGDDYLYEIGIQHALRFIEFCVQDAGSVIQSVRFNTETGEVIKHYTHKGYSDESIWARAQAWAMLGYALDASWEPDREEFVDTAMLTADWWIDNVSNDKVAFWDFDAPATAVTKRDTSATAIAAAAFLKLSALAPGGENRRRYREAAEATIRTLVEDYLTPTAPEDDRPPGILTSGCYNHRTGLATENELIWGDYYLKLPSNVGAFSALLITISVIGAVGGSAANLIYPYLMRDKGWRGPRYRKLQIYDLLVGVASLVVINLAIWVVAAETMRGRANAIADPDDLAAMMEHAVGAIGPTLMWIAIFFIAFDNIPAYSYGFTRILVEAVHETFPERGARYAHAARTGSHGDSPVIHSPEGDVSKEELVKRETSMRDPIFRISQIGLLIVLPLIFSLPGTSDFIVLTILANAMAVLTAPIIMVGVILITNNRRWMLPAYRNKWWENIILLVVAGIGLWATYGLITSFADFFGG